MRVWTAVWYWLLQLLCLPLGAWWEGTRRAELVILPEGRGVHQVRAGRCLTPLRGHVPQSLEERVSVGAMGLGGEGGRGIAERVTGK